ncbi:MAG: PD-(D/E)XK nuclease family protein [Verrucomicrobiota bacterium]
MNQSLLAKEVAQIANRFDSVIYERKRAQSKIVRDVGDAIEARIDELSRPLREKLKATVNLYDISGTTPSILRIMGQSHLEKPFNRMLKWCANVHAEHGFGRLFLSRLASLVRLSVMKRDLDQEHCEVKVYGEEALDPSRNMPDLVVLTPNAALLLENKVGSGESGNQYQPYLTWFPGFAKPRKAFLVLASREPSAKPSGWHGAITHPDLAGIFHEIAALPQPQVTVWGRIVAAQCAVAFGNTSPAAAIAEARELLAQTSRPRITPEQFHQLSALQNIPPPTEPWSAI